MKKGIHPENYRLVAFKDMSNNDIFLAKSTAQTNETVSVEGVEYPLVKLEISRTLIHITLEKLSWLILLEELINSRLNMLNSIKNSSKKYYLNLSNTHLRGFFFTFNRLHN